MLFLVQWTLTSDTRDAVQNRFKQTGGPPPPGVKVIGRWHSLSQSSGLAIAEASDPVAIGKWCQSWSDLLELDVMPVADDEVTMRIIGG
jgi:hypothetical protein